MRDFVYRPDSAALAARLFEQENTKMAQLFKRNSRKIGVDPERDPSVNVLEQATRPEKLVEQIDTSFANSQEQKASQ